MMPMTIGTRQETRAVVLGTMKLSRKPTTITPIRIRLVLAPILDRTKRAMRLSSPVNIMAAAINRAPPTRAKAPVLKPDSAISSPFVVPRTTLGLAMLGAVPSKKDMRAMTMEALTG